MQKKSRPPSCRATGPQGPVCNFFSSFFAGKPLPPGSGAAGVYLCKFPNRKYIFVKNRNKKYKNKKTASAGRLAGSREEPPCLRDHLGRGISTSSGGAASRRQGGRRLWSRSGPSGSAAMACMAMCVPEAIYSCMCSHCSLPMCSHTAAPDR